MENIAYYIKTISISAIPILMAIILHEIAHGWVANRFGDPTARHAGRLTLNPIPHIDIFGTVILPVMLLVLKVGVVFGYAKPVPINPYNLKEPRKDMVWIAAAGPSMNLILAILSAISLRIISIFDQGLLRLQSPVMARGAVFGHSVLYPLALMCIISIQINIVLGLFNLIPIPPADGGRIMAGILPSKQAELYSKIEPFGMVILFVIILFDNHLGILSRILYPMVEFLTRLLIWI